MLFMQIIKDKHETFYLEYHAIVNFERISLLVLVFLLLTLNMQLPAG